MSLILRSVALVAVVVCLGCGPSKAERAQMEKSLAEQAEKNRKEEEERKSLLPRLTALADALRANCAAEFKRVSDENLGAGPDAVADCGLPKEPTWRMNIASTRGAPEDLGAAMVRECDELQKELDLAVKRAGPDNPSSSRDWDARANLEQFSRTVVVGLVHDTRVFPELVKDGAGNPKSFKPGKFDGTAYLFPLSAAKVTCVSRVAATNSEKIEYAKIDALGAEGTASGDIDRDLEKHLAEALNTAARTSLAPVPKAAPAKAAAKSKAKPSKKKKTR